MLIGRILLSYKYTSLTTWTHTGSQVIYESCGTKVLQKSTFQALDGFERLKASFSVLIRTSQTCSIDFRSTVLTGQSTKHISPVFRILTTRWALTGSPLKWIPAQLPPWKCKYRISKYYPYRSHESHESQSHCQAKGKVCIHVTRFLPWSSHLLCHNDFFLEPWNTDSGLLVFFQTKIRK